MSVARARPLAMRWALLVLSCAEVAAEPPRVSDKALQHDIDQAIRRGIAYLKSSQQSDGSWTEQRTGVDPSCVGGLSALSLFALASSGVPADDPAIARGLAFLAANSESFDGEAEVATYANATLVLALSRISPGEHRKTIHDAARRIVAGQLENGMWGYRLTVRTSTDRDPKKRKGGPGLGTPDNSNTQFAALALWAAQVAADFRVPRVTWERVRDHFVRTQERDGRWSYRADGRRRSNDSMTAAGVMCLGYALASLNGKATAAAREHDRVQRGLSCLPLDVIDPKLAEGLKTRAPKFLNYYWAYSLERVGTVLALDPETWYAPGARWLLKAQSPTGRWPESWPSLADGYPYETSLALLFLTGATRAFTATRGEAPLETSTPKGLANAFDLYAASNAESRELLLPDLRCREMVGLAIAKLRDRLVSVRAAAFELLSLLVDRPFLFDPAAGFGDREVMLGPIEAFWKEKGERLTWDVEKGRFVVR
ncbi:MAG TPA: hypothetical protein VFY93_17185 [Planctomycetota bacterium]|nr:hypothetical protein [Planctomycetota bacterium]